MGIFTSNWVVPFIQHFDRDNRAIGHETHSNSLSCELQPYAKKVFRARGLRGVGRRPEAWLEVGQDIGIA